jgi:hypothetical protein
VSRMAILRLGAALEDAERAFGVERRPAIN